MQPEILSKMLPFSQCHPVPAALVITGATSLKAAPSGVLFFRVPEVSQLPGTLWPLTSVQWHQPPRPLHKPRGPPIDRARAIRS